MTTRTSTGRAIEIPDLVGDKADKAIQRLRELGLMPIMWSAEVDDVNHAGFVLGLDPPAGTPVRPKAPVTMSVATHPDFQGHADDSFAQSDELVQPPLTWPLSSPSGLAAPATPPPHADASVDAFATAATPGAPSAPASSPIDAASREIRHPDAAASSAEQPTPGVAADPYDVSAPVPAPDEISAEDEWTRLRAAEAARHAADHPASDELQAPPLALIEYAPEETAPQVDADALEEQARRQAARRRARRRRRLTLRQKAIVASVLAVTVLIGVMAMSGRKPQADPAKTAHIASHHRKRLAHSAATPAMGGHEHARPAAHHTRAKAASRPVRHHKKHRRPHERVTRAARERIRTHVTTVTLHAPGPSSTATNSRSSAAPIDTTPSTTTPASAGAGSPTTAAPPTSNPPAASTPSHQSSSVPSSSGSGSSGTGGGSTLQSPDGTTAPPQP